MPTKCIADRFGFSGVECRSVVAFDGGAVTSDAWALLLGAGDRAIGLLDRFAGCFDDARAQGQAVHEAPAMAGQRVFGIALGYEDMNDHDTPRNDPVFGALSARLEARHPRCATLAGKSTLNRLEHAPAGVLGRYHKIAHDGAAIEHMFADLFIGARARPPKRLVLDLDATDDPIHGHHEGRFFQGYYDGFCYPPFYVFCVRHLLAAKLRRSNIDASAGSVEVVERIVGRIRARWPRVRITLRADSGFAGETLMAWCEANRVDYVFELARNQRLSESVAGDLAWAEEQSTATGKPARRFADFLWRTLDSWSRRRRVLAKAEWATGSANPHFVVTSLKARAYGPKALYKDLY